jgi:hypothetical protein
MLPTMPERPRRRGCLPITADMPYWCAWNGQANQASNTHYKPGYGGRPDCDNATWCHSQWAHRTQKSLGLLGKCFVDDVKYLSEEDLVCIGICAAFWIACVTYTKGFGTPACSGIAAACFIGCGASWLGKKIRNGFRCYGFVQESNDAAKQIYCSCIKWKERKCGQYGAEPQVLGGCSKYYPDME